MKTRIRIEAELGWNSKTGEITRAPAWVTQGLNQSLWSGEPPKEALAMVRDGETLACHGVRLCQGRRFSPSGFWVGQVCVKGQPRPAKWRKVTFNGESYGVWWVEMAGGSFSYPRPLNSREDALAILKSGDCLDSPMVAARRIGWTGWKARDAMEALREAVLAMLPENSSYKSRADLPDRIKNKLNALVEFPGGPEPSEIDLIREQLDSLARIQSNLMARLDALQE